MFRVPREVVADLLLALFAPSDESPSTTPQGRAGRRGYRLGLCRALELVGLPMPEVEDAILRETYADAQKRREVG